MIALLGMALIGAGTLFFIAGTVGLLRFPDLYCQLHALTKADGVGLALIGLGAALLSGSVGDIARIALICAFAALSGATCGHLIARHARRAGQEEGDA